ncbi:hypothetical protein Syun_022999 [Stephania yunnanensis]|uniref:Uncharacterized protein n=1 Tax=Stephania yunnanensis TaxID=152371 RepID=A0AAP0FL45_9MAGN
MASQECSDRGSAGGSPRSGSTLGGEEQRASHKRRSGAANGGDRPGWMRGSATIGRRPWWLCGSAKVGERSTGVAWRGQRRTVGWRGGAEDDDLVTPASGRQRRRRGERRVGTLSTGRLRDFDEIATTRTRDLGVGCRVRKSRRERDVSRFAISREPQTRSRGKAS